MPVIRSAFATTANVMLLLLMFLLLPIMMIYMHSLFRYEGRMQLTGLSEGSHKLNARLLRSYLEDRLTTVTDPEIERGERAEFRWRNGAITTRGEVPNALIDSADAWISLVDSRPWQESGAEWQERNWWAIGRSFIVDDAEWMLEVRLIQIGSDSVYQGALTPADLYFDQLIFDWFADFRTTDNGIHMRVPSVADNLLIRVIPNITDRAEFDLHRGVNVDNKINSKELQLTESNYLWPHELEFASIIRSDLLLKEVADKVWTIIYSMYAIVVAVVIAQQIRLRRLRKRIS
jgi:hypothetical protein